MPWCCILLMPSGSHCAVAGAASFGEQYLRTGVTTEPCFVNKLAALIAFSSLKRAFLQRIVRTAARISCTVAFAYTKYFVS